MARRRLLPGHKVNEIARKVLTGSQMRYFVVIEAAYYVGRLDRTRNTMGFIIERDMLQHLVYTFILSGEYQNWHNASNLVDRLLDHVEEHPRKEGK